MSLNYHLVSRVEFLTRIKMEHEDLCFYVTILKKVKERV